MKIKRKNKRIIRVLCTMLLCLMLLPCSVLFLPNARTAVNAADPGGDLEVRVGYFGDDQDYRTKAVLTRDDLESLGTAVYQYSNVTRVGTVMGTIARGPAILDILDAAGIDTASVQTINLRTTDGTQVNNWFVSLNMDQWVNATRFYYPFLRGNYERIEDEEGGTDPEEGMAQGQVLPGPGALRGAKVVPAILAIESYSTKDPDEKIDESMMNESVSYRFCAGQNKMTDGVPCGDVSSMNSAQWVFGIDVTLYGSPDEATDLDLSLNKKDLIVGSKAQISYQIYGAELFEEKVNGTLTWKSSNPSIATVDANGVVTIKKKGKVTITATTANGISKSVTINALEKKTKKQKQEKKKEPEKKKETNKQQKNTEKTEVNRTQKIVSNQSYPERKKEQEAEKNKVEQKTKQEREKEQEKEQEQEQEKKTAPGLREVLIDGDMYEREEMSAKAKPLDAQKRSPYASAVAMCGGGFCAAAGGIIRFLKFLKEVR